MVALIVVVANILTAARLICYQRNNAQYRLGMSVLAYLLIVCAGGQVIDVLINQTPVTPWQAGFSAVVALLVIRARGNVASVVRVVS